MLGRCWWVLLGVWLVPPEAGAFCRSTTCTKGCEVDEEGCKTSGLVLSWAGGCVGVSLQRDGTVHLPFGEVSDALDASLAAWSAVPCAGGGAASVTFARLQNVVCARTESVSAGPNANVVMFRDNDWRYKGTDNTLGFTTVTFSTATGEILGADMEINAAFNELTTGQPVAYDLRSILTHELGHLLGLGHSSDPEATMVADYEKGSIAPRDLSDDDVAAICAAYPPGRQAACDPTPRGGFASSCAPDAVAEAPDGEGCSVPPGAGERGPLAWLAFPGALLGALRARRRRGR